MRYLIIAYAFLVLIIGVTIGYNYGTLDNTIYRVVMLDESKLPINLYKGDLVILSSGNNTEFFYPNKNMYITDFLFLNDYMRSE